MSICSNNVHKNMLNIPFCYDNMQNSKAIKNGRSVREGLATPHGVYRGLVKHKPTYTGLPAATVESV